MTLGTTFPGVLQESWNGENYGFVYAIHHISWFRQAGLRDAGQLFSSYFLRWPEDGILRFVLEFKVQPRPHKSLFGCIFGHKF